MAQVQISPAKALWSQQEAAALWQPEADIQTRTQAFHNAQGQATAELLRWLVPLDESIVLNKDGSLLACFEFDGLDMDSKDADDMNSARNQIQYALTQMQEHELVMTWQVRRRLTTDYPAGHFPDPCSQAIDDLLKEQFLAQPQFVNRHSASLVLKPPAGAMQLMSRLARAQAQGGSILKMMGAMLTALKGAVMGQDDFPYQDLEDISGATQEFLKVIHGFVANLTPLGVRWLQGDALGTYLTQAISPCEPSLNVNGLTEAGWYMDTDMAKGQIDGQWREVLHFTQGGQEDVWAICKSLSLAKRKELSLDVLDDLMSAPFDCVLSHVFEFLPRKQGVSTVQQIEKYHGNRKYSVKSILAGAVRGGDFSGVKINTVRDEAASQTENLKNRIDMGTAGVGRHYSTVMVLAKNYEDVVAASSGCDAILSAARLSPVTETLHKLSSFLATVPASHHHVARWKPIKTINFGDLCPARTIEKGHRNNHWMSEQLGVPCEALLALPTAHRTPYYYTGYVGDVGHLFLIGPNGSGKTTFASLDWVAFRKYPGSRVIIFDKDYSVRPAIMLQGGQYIDLNPEGVAADGLHKPKLAPLRALGANGNREHLTFLVNWIGVLVAHRGYKIETEDRTKLVEALNTVIEQGIQDPSYLTLSNLLVHINWSTQLAHELQPWTKGQINGDYFDNEEDSFELDSLTGVEMGSILTNAELAAPFMAYAFERIALQLRDLKAKRGVEIVPTIIYIPEVWFFISNAEFAKMLENWLKTLRKLGGRVLMDTQSPDELARSPIFGALRDNVLTMVFTPNIKARSGTLAKMYLDDFALTEKQLHMISTGVPKRDYIIVQDGKTRKISLNLNRQTMAYLRSDRKAQVTLERLRRSDPEQWRELYLKELNRD